MDELRRSVGLRGYGQKDPLSEYKNEAFRAFEEMMVSMRSDVCSGMFRSSTNLAAFENMLSNLSGVARATGPDSNPSGGFDRFSGGTQKSGQSTQAEAPDIPKIATPVVRDTPKVGRNELGPCEAVKSIRNVVVLEFQLNHLVLESCQIKVQFVLVLMTGLFHFFHPLIKFSLYFFIFFLCD